MPLVWFFGQANAASLWPGGFDALRCGHPLMAKDYQAPFNFTGKIHRVTVDVSGELIQDDEAELVRIMARQEHPCEGSQPSQGWKRGQSNITSTEVIHMSVREWILLVGFLTLYITFIFSVAMLTFLRKDTPLWGFLGIIFPILWLIDAVLPAKTGSRYDVEQAMRYQEKTEQMTR